MKIGVGIIYHEKLNEFLPAVEKCFNRFDIKKKVADFKKQPEHEARNEMLAQFGGYDFVWVIDSDELLTVKDQDKIINKAVNNNLSIGLIHLIDYASENRMIEMRDHCPIVIVKPDVRFYTNRCANLKEYQVINGVVLHHIGFMAKPETAEWKQKNHWNNAEYKDYINTIKKTTLPCEMPEEIKELIKGDKQDDERGVNDNISVKEKKRTNRRDGTLHKSGNTGKVESKAG